ncbi:MAG: diversity-generating retroelement protein Avd [Clostridia bacterium]
MSTNSSNNNSNLIIYQKYLELIYYTNDLVRKYPKSETFALVKEIKSALYSGFRFLMYAIKSYKVQDKLKNLSELDIQLDLMKVYIRLSHKYKYISTQNYNAWCTILTNICNMLGGWIQSCQKR